MSESDECPLCMEVMEIDDLNFFPCSCGYQICRFCWHRIRTDENGLCPACRKAYSEDPAMYQPLSRDEIQKIKKERKQREVQRKQKITESRKHLSNVRVIQKNLLFVVGLSQRLADTELLKKHEYFGKYGKILKVIINPSTNYAGPQGPSASAYITYSKEEENLRAILAVNNIQQDGRTLRVSLGTTKYCTHFLRNMQCKNPDCMYLHEMGDNNACFTKEDMQQGKHLAYERDLLENFQKTLDQRRKSQELDNDQHPADQFQQKEDWSEEINDVHQNSALPPKAAWAERESEKDALENEKSSLSNGAEEDDVGPTWSNTNGLKDFIEPSEDLENYEKSNSPSDSGGTSPLGSSLPQEILHPTFATGWATSQETKLSNQIATGTFDDKSEQSYLSAFWPVSDLGLKNLQVSNDDGLGFDPFDEYNKGLADLLAAERAQASNEHAAATRPTGRAAWPSTSTGNESYFANVSKDTSQQYSLFGDASPGSRSTSFFDTYFNPASNGDSVHVERPSVQSDRVYSAIPPARQFAHPESPQKSQLKSGGPDALAWQDGLRALLPNVNISFSDQVSKLRQDSHRSKKPPWREQEIDRDLEHFNSMPSEFLQTTKRPPPGLDPSASPAENSIWTKIAKNEKQKVATSSVQQAGSFSSQVASMKPAVPVPSEGQLTQPTTPWNAVVGRAQGNAIPVHHEGNHLVMQNQGVEGKSTMKPLTSFASGNHLKSQKPTAKVRPQMKCMTSPSQEAPPNILQRSNSRGSSNVSRMNDLDDISLTDPMPVNRNTSSTANVVKETAGSSKEGTGIEAAFQVEATKKSSKKKKKNKEKNKEKQDFRKMEKVVIVPSDKSFESNAKGRQDDQKNKKEKVNEKQKDERLKEPIKIQQRPKQTELVRSEMKQGKSQPSSAYSRPDPPKIRILKTDTPNTSAVATMTQSSPMESVSKSYPGQDVFSQLAETTEKLLQNVLTETEVIKSNTEQISKDLKNALEKRKEQPLTVADLEKINLLSSPMAKNHLQGRKEAQEKRSEPTFSVADWEKLSYLLSSSVANGHLQGKQQKTLIDTLDLERQVDLARKEAEILEVRLNDVIKKNMASEVEKKKDGSKRN